MKMMMKIMVIFYNYFIQSTPILFNAIHLMKRMSANARLRRR